MHRKGLAVGLLVVFLSTLTSGCWDRRELQERGFVIAVAIDIAEDGKISGSELETFTQGGGNKPLRLSLQVLKLLPTGGEEGGGGQSKEGGKTFVLSNTGRTSHDMIRDMLGQISKSLYFEHIQAILISEAAIKQYPLRRLIDFWRRDAEMRWRTRIFVVPGQAREVLEFQPPTGEPGGVFLAGIARQYAKDAHISTTLTDLGATSQILDAGGDVLLPRLEYKEKKIKINGLAVFKKDKFLGYWDEYTIKGIRMIRGNVKSAIISYMCPVHPGEVVSFELFRHNTILKTNNEGGNLYFTINSAWRGNISEVTCQQNHDTLDPEFLEKAEVLLAEEIKRNMSHSLNIAREWNVDAVMFGKMLKAYEPEAWRYIEGNWDEVFPTIPLYVDVRVSIQNVGEHK